MKLVVIIPAYNEEKTVGEVVRSIPGIIPGFSERAIIVVNDGSGDGTVLESERAGARVVSHGRNRGLGNAFATGIQAALGDGADIIVSIDADGQFDAREISKITAPIVGGEADMVSGSRFLEPASRAAVPLMRRIGNYGFTKLVNSILGTRFSDTQCGFRAYNRQAAMRLNLFGDFTYTQEVFVDLFYKGMRIMEVPISVRYFKDRKAKISSSLFRYMWRAFAVIFQTLRDKEPLKFFGIPGVFLLALGLIADAYAFFFWLYTHVTTPIRMLFFVGTVLIGIGLILVIFAFLADMVKRVRETQDDILFRLKQHR
ncbi:MAG: glycosyltransferase family 2 protein [bacterium]|nr:glycosyltransferase family 2 protein [bacterium]